MATPTHEVIRAIPGLPGVEAGGLVDASAWRNAPKLERMRYIKPLPPDVKALRARIAELEAEVQALKARAGGAAARR